MPAIGSFPSVILPHVRSMPLTIEEKKHYRALAHALKPVVTIAGKGLSEGVLQEIDRALNDHELIKVKVKVGEREVKHQVIEELCATLKADWVQTIGNIAILLRRATKPNPKLSNLIRQGNISN